MESNLDQRVAALEAELFGIHRRNQTVELHKAWETSRTRRLSILLVTYLLAFAFFRVMQIPNPELNALVPAGGYALSTQSLAWIRAIWFKGRMSRDG